MVKDSVYADMEESEKLVASYLRELNIWWIYESPVFVYDEKDRLRVWTPDFYKLRDVCRSLWFRECQVL